MLTLMSIGLVVANDTLTEGHTNTIPVIANTVVGTAGAAAGPDGSGLVYDIVVDVIHRTVAEAVVPVDAVDVVVVGIGVGQAGTTGLEDDHTLVEE